MYRFAFFLAITAGAYAQVSVAPGGVLNAASYAKDPNGLGSAIAPGSLVAIFGSFTGASLATADTIPYSVSLGSAGVTFNGVPAPIVQVSPSGAFPFISAQVPFEVNPGVANVVVTVNGVSSAPEQTNVVAAAPGVFTIPPDGQSNAVFVYLDPSDNTAKIAAPASAQIGYPTAPVPRGTNGFFYATGLGAMTPAVQDGDGGAQGPTHYANATPVVLVGGIAAQVQFAGQAPGFPGVYQVNIQIPQNAPTGNAVSLQMQTADGTITSTAKATIAIQ